MEQGSSVMFEEFIDVNRAKQRVNELDYGCLRIYDSAMKVVKTKGNVVISNYQELDHKARECLKIEQELKPLY